MTKCRNVKSPNVKCVHLIVSELWLFPDGHLVIVADPLDALGHVGSLVVLVESHVPAVVRLLQLLADLVVPHEPVLSGVWSLKEEEDFILILRKLNGFNILLKKIKEFL